MIRKLVLSAILGSAAIAGLALTPASASARPPEIVPVYRPAYYPPAYPYHPHHHHHSLFGVSLYAAPAPTVFYVRPAPPPVLYVPAPVYRPAIVIPAPCPR